MEDKPGQAAVILPPRYRDTVLALGGSARAEAEEFRLRLGAPFSLGYAGGRERVFTSLPAVTAHDLSVLMENATQGSLHAALESLRSGFLTVQGGHRLGVCGNALLRDGKLIHLRDISSVCLRIAREWKGAADSVLPRILTKDGVHNTLILSPPGLGKTTLLRDIVRKLSDGEGTVPRRVSVADERGELCGCVDGQPQMSVGMRTDIWTGLPKGEAVVMLLRGLAPRVLALDEITAPQDVRAVEMCVGCGVSVLATAHASGPEDLYRRPVYRGLESIFTRLIVIGLDKGKRVYTTHGEENGTCGFR